MNITLTPKLQKYIQRQIKAGRYRTPDEMIRKALRQSMERDRDLDELRESLDEAGRQLERGEGIPLSQITVERIRNGALQHPGPLRKKKAS